MRILQTKKHIYFEEKECLASQSSRHFMVTQSYELIKFIAEIPYSITSALILDFLSEQGANLKVVDVNMQSKKACYFKLQSVEGTTEDQKYESCLLKIM
jgi:16S rRNA A1518/A1519 N6-dimethyltransferase RsmA/KsgA/DIM1 with predicted DNA glycosylase/AP lyase activity